MGVFKLFLEFKEEYDIPNQSFFKYLQVRDALGTQFKERPVEWSEVTILRKIVYTNTSKGVISFIYDSICDRVIKGNEELPCRRGWEKHLGDITNEQWKHILEIGPLSTLSPSQTVSYLMLLHRVYKTPQKLLLYGWRSDAKCPRCSHPKGDLVHMMWRCPKLNRYWSKVIGKINKVFGIILAVNPKICLFGCMKNK